MKYSAIILAAGSGLRTGLNTNKILIQINGRCVVDYSLKYFQNDPNCGEVILVVSKRDFKDLKNLYKSSSTKVIIGGAHRQDSVYNALKIAVFDYVLVHDGARPFVLKDYVDEIVDNLIKYPSITLGVKVKETIQQVQGNHVVKTLDRNSLITTQTPQGFKKDILIKAHQLAFDDTYFGTDDTVLIERYLDITAFVVKGDYRNIKLTTLDDIGLLEVILK
ncbi:MAG: 2-C-methyl-D-erythritol 4-phosphate cytidylyltransferase [Candidatus Izimaplasma sp.]|nr:2-C-methyl-D-erythritol 4-phosphate cytidylyltransferase [Candidatus Izimaplasma bacterium]